MEITPQLNVFTCGTFQNTDLV